MSPAMNARRERSISSVLQKIDQVRDARHYSWRKSLGFRLNIVENIAFMERLKLKRPQNLWVKDWRWNLAGAWRVKSLGQEEVLCREAGLLDWLTCGLGLSCKHLIFPFISDLIEQDGLRWGRGGEASYIQQVLTELAEIWSIPGGSSR